MIEVAIKVLRGMDRTMIKAGYSRQQRRKVWRDLARSREDAIRYLERTLGIWIISFLLLSGVVRAESIAIYKVLMAEAVSEGYQGMYAVACVIRNRGGDLRGFAGAERKDLDAFCRRQGKYYISRARTVERKVFKENGPDITAGATHFENVEQFGRPGWADDMMVTCKIGQHTFFKEKKKIAGN